MLPRGTSTEAKRPIRKKVAFTAPEAQRLGAEARAAGMTESKYMHAAVLACWGDAEKPKPKPKRTTQLMAITHLLGLIVFLIKKLSNNVNQLAKQANTGLVPIKRNEVDYVLNQHQVVISKTIAAVESIYA